MLTNDITPATNDVSPAMDAAPLLPPIPPMPPRWADGPGALSSVNRQSTVRRRRWPWLAGLAAVVIAAGAGTTWWLHREDHGPVDRRAVILPTTLVAKPPAPDTYEFANQQWTGIVRDVVGNDHAFGGRSYLDLDANGGPQMPALNLVVVRGHFPHDLDLKTARAPLTTVGAVTCTNTFDLSSAELGERAPQRSDSMTVCYRTEQHLTVSVMALGSSATMDSAAVAVNEAWALQ